MKVKRIVSNIEASNSDKATGFYAEIFGLELLMDLGWIRTYGSSAKIPVQVSIATEGGSGTSVPDLSIEVDDLDAVLLKLGEANVPVEYGPENDPWGVRRFYVRDPFGKSLTYCNTSPSMKIHFDERSDAATLDPYCRTLSHPRKIDCSSIATGPCE